MRSTAQIQADFDKVADDSVTYGQMQTELLMDIRRLLIFDLCRVLGWEEQTLLEALDERLVQLPTDRAGV